MVDPAVSARHLRYYLKVALNWRPRRQISTQSLINSRRMATHVSTSFYVAYNIHSLHHASCTGSFGVAFHSSAYIVLSLVGALVIYCKGKLSNVVVVTPWCGTVEAIQDHEII